MRVRETQDFHRRKNSDHVDRVREQHARRSKMFMSFVFFSLYYIINVFYALSSSTNPTLRIYSHNINDDTKLRLDA